MIPKFSIFIVDAEDFKEQEEEDNESIANFRTIEVIQKDTQDKYIMKKYNSLDEHDKIQKLFWIFDFLMKNQFPCFLQPSYITFENEKNDFNAIFLKFMNLSLHNIVEQQMGGLKIPNFDDTQEFIILYGISLFLECFHANKKVHGNLKLTNVLLDKNFFPFVSDPYLFENIYPKKKSETVDCVVSLSPEELNDQKPTKESDIYSFGILILQVLKHEINVFSHFSEKVDQIVSLIQTHAKPKLDGIPPKITEILDSCFSENPKKRPSASDVKKVFKEILSDEKYEKRLKEFEASLVQKNEQIDPEIKRKADIGDLDSMFIYGKNMFQNNHIKVGMDYLRLAAKKGYVPAKDYYNNVRKDNQLNLDTKQDDSSDQNEKKTFTHLKDETFFEKENFNVKQITSDIKKNIDDDDVYNFEEEKLINRNFIPTKEAIKRLTTLKKYIDAGIPVILEGPTGTSKTVSSEIICELTGREIIRFNLSSETKSTDLLGRYVGESDSWAGIIMLPGPFMIAFKEGKTLLLDEINLASSECLQFIEDTLDSGVISVEMQGIPLKEIKMHPDFRLIATQNPNKDLFAHKRQDLGNKFMSRFQVIYFTEFTDELYDIAKGLANKFNYQNVNKDKIIKDLVDFHRKWSSSKDIKDDIQCFTIREIAAAVKALSENQNIYDTIMTIYGARYQKEKRDKLEELFQSYQSFKNCKPSSFNYPDNFPNCFHNKSLSDALKSILFSFKNHRHVILAGVEGSGLTQIARWVSHWYQKEHNKEFNLSNKKYFCICTKETKCSDLIGKHKISENFNGKNDNSEVIQWKTGFLTEAVIKGYLAVLDNLEEAPATVTERLNGLLDQKFEDENNEKKFIFEIPENPKQREVNIHKNFRLLCTCKIDNLNQMSPAFINRFDVIVLENQIQDNEDDLKSLITMLLKREKPSNFTPNQEVVNQVYQRIHPIPTMFQLSQLCRAVTKYIDFFGKNVDHKKIVDFSFDMLNKNQDFKIPSEIEECLLKTLKKQEDNNDSKFFFLKSPNLKDIITKIYAASLINLPVCLYGPTGVGKTSAAREFSRIRPTKNELNEPFLMHTFHAGTKPKDFCGTTTISNEQVLFINGTLTTAMVNGQTFIADEMNLSSISTMESLSPALEPITKQSLYIAGVEEPIQVNDEFFFIACQNELGTNGRNAIPRSIASRFRYFYYPKQELNDISPICIQIAHSFYKEGEKKSFSDEDSEKVGKYMLELNNLKKRVIPQWSLRDITKLFLRIHYQDTNRNNFKNMTLCKNILFYTLSPLNKEDIKDVFQDVIKLIGDTFSLTEKQRNELEKCYNSKPSIVNNYLMKSDSGILIKTSKNAEIFNSLPSLLNSMFQVLLSDSSEPILLMGESGFKTFLAQQFLEDAKIVTLNQESTIAQLLGSSAFLSKEESKSFYIENICKICHIYNKIHEFTKQYNDKKLSKEYLKSIIDPIVLGLPKSLKYSINHFVDKLFDNNQSRSNNCVLSTIELEFKPGLFLSAILECKSLILKNLSNLPTIILERFNELFSGKHNLTMNEDIHNTFTSQTDKELTDISSNFRVFGTCPPNSVNKLSEAVLSRFTVICIPAYELSEQKLVLKSYIKLNNLHFDDSLISILVDFSEKMNTSLHRNFLFPQMINSIEMCSRLNENSDKSQWRNNLGIILYRLVYGLFENRNESKESFLKIFNDLKMKLPSNLISPNEGNPLSISQSNDGYQGIQSNISNIFFRSSNAKENNNKVAFTPMFSEMLDTLLLGISINIPVIFEGMPGQGKQTAINYISEMLGYQVINVVISQNTKVEDLFGKITITRDNKNNIKIQPIETKLVKVLKSNSDFNNNNSIIVFHNINNASSAVLEVLVSIFDQHQKDFLLPNGSTIKKEQVKIVGIFNPQNGIFNRDKLPSLLIYSSIYHIVNDPKNNEILSVIENQFINTEFGAAEAENFYNNFIETKKISEDANASPLTLNDIVKYKKFRNVTYKKVNEDIISSMLFAYRFIDHKTFDETLKIINVNDMKFNPVFIFNSESGKLSIRVFEKDGITLDFDPKNVDINSIKSDIATLTLPERRCILFLAFSVLSKQACLIKGETASGKSHIIRLFAKMLGKKLNVYQMNSETTVSILTGQSVLSNQLSKQDIDDINSALTDLERIPEIREYIEKNIIDKTPNEWSRSLFTNLINFISADKFSKNPEYEKIIEPSKQIIVETIQPAKRFHIEKSSFINAMINGEWVLFDGIESASSEIIEKISSLCGANPQIDLLECGEGYYFTLDNLPGSNKINENFHLFFTYNPFSKVENKTLDQSFINNCASFTLPSIDSIPENSAQRFLGTLIQYFPKEFSVEISERLAMMHAFAKEESKNDSDSFAGELQFTGRTINFISKEFSHHVKVCQDPVETIFRPICYSIKYYYLNSYINAEKENKFKANLIDNFAKKIDQNKFQKLTYEGINLKDKYKEILIALRNIQISESKGKNSSNFKYSDFVQNCYQFIQINDIDYILDHINDTLDIIYKSDKDFTKEFSQLKIIALILNDIKKGMKNLNEECYTLNLSDKDLLKTKQLNQPLSRFNLLSKLVLTKDINIFSSPNIPLYFYDSNFVSLMNSIKIMKSSNNLDTFENFISILNTYPNFIPLIESRFPYNIFDKTPFKMIRYILPMIRLLHESNTSFQIHVSDEKYLFKYEKLSLFEPIYVIEYNSELTLSSSSKIIFKINPKINFNDILQKDQFKDDESINNFFYNITNNFVSDKKNISTFLNSKYPLNFINKLNPRKDQIPQLSQLFSIKQLSSLVTIIWPLIYLFSKDTINIFSDYLLPLEKDTLFAFYHIFESINKDNVEQLFDFSNWMKDFGKENSCLWQIINKRFKINPNIQYKEACDIEKQIEEEIKYLESAPRLLPKESWPIESYINKLNEQKDKINHKKDELAQKDENLRLKKKLNPIIEQLEKAPSKKNESLKLQIINEIRKDSENLSEEKIKFYQNQVNRFIESLKQEDNNYAKNTICWPTYKLTSDLSDYESPTKKLYEIIIWYSTIISIFNKINDKNNQNIFNYIVELNNFDEMQDAVNFLTSRFLHIENSSKKVLNSDENSIINGILNANFICKLKKSKLLDQIDQLTSILNSLEDRNAIDDENILSWIHKIANQYTPDFYISLPKFQPKDLIYLFIGYDKDGSNSLPGPLLKSSFSTPANLINNLHELLKTNFSNSVQCSIAIAQNIIKLYTKEEGTNDLNKLKEILNKYQSNKYVKLAIEVIDIAKKIDLMKKADFTFNDTFFFKENWIKKEEYMDRYPSLVFWLCKNYLCADKLKNIFGSQQFSNDKLPFWLFVLRLMSSENCIIFDTNSTTQTGKKLSKIIDKTIRNQIRNKIDQKKHIGTKWLNVFLPSPPPEVSIQNYQIFYQMFYQFFLNLSDDKKSLQDEIFDVKKKQLKLFVKKVFDFVFNDDLNAFFDIPLNSKNDFIISLIRDPNSFVCKEINNEMKTISNNFLKSPKMRDLSNFTSKLKDVVNTHIKTLKSIIDKEDKENEKKCNDERTKYRKKQLKTMKKNIQESIKEYNKKFKKILKHEPINNMGEFQKRCNSLIECLNDLPQYFDMTGEPIKLLKYEKKTKYKYPYYFHTIRLNKNDSIRIFDKTPYYFYPEHFDELDEKLRDDITMWTGIELFPINQQFDIDQFCERNCRITKVFEKPKLLFGKSYYHQYLMTYDQFISKITRVSVEAINFVKNLQEEINRGRINDDTFRAPSDLINILQNLTNNFYSQYSDDSKCDNINKFLTKMKDIFIQLKNYISAVDNELTYKVEVMWKAAYQRFEIKPVFDDVYKLPIPISKSTKYSYYHPFQTIKNTNFISNPILNVDNGSIFCCFNSLNCNLGSFVPSLYSRKITMNFISFIDEPFTMKLETNSEYMNLFPSKPCQFSKGESVQILFSLPEVKSKEPENHEISTKIIFESEKLNKLVLPCNFSVKIVPLSFLISCKQSKLAFKNNAFYVCKDTFIPPQVLTFSIKNFYLKEPTNVKYQLISLDGNTATRPIINHKYDELELQIPKVSSVKRLNAELKLKFSDSFSTSVLIDSIIIPFDFEFEVYDPIEKKFGKNAIVYYTPKYLDRKILLHFRILCPSLSEELSGEIKHSFTYDIQVIKLEDKFKINKNREFDTAIKIRSPLKSKYNYYHYYEEQNPTYKLTVYINGINKSISLEFSELKDQILTDSQINTKYLDKFNGYAYKETDKKWNPIHKYDETIGYSCFVSSFSCYKPLELRVFYNLGCKVYDNDCIFVYINKDGEIIEKKTTEPRIEKKNDGLFGKIKKYFISDSNSDFYPIFGISRNNWFPVFDTYPSIDNWVKIEDDKILLAKNEIEQVNKKYPSEILNPCNFMSLFRLLDQGKVIKQIKSFIQLLPIDIKKEFDYIIAYAEILDENDPAMKVQSHNAILLFKQLFEARYKEIKNSKYNTCSLTQEEIDQQIAKSYEEYSRIDTRYLSNTLNSNKFVEIETDVQNIQLEPKPESRSEAFLYTEKSSPIPKNNYCTPKYTSSNNSEISYSSFNGIKFELPNLDVDDINSITIPKLNDIYLSAIKGARLLPIFVSNMKSQKSVKMENEAEKYFYNLLYLYENLPVKDMSFISLTTNLFNESFSSMIGKFKKAGVDFGRILPDKCKVSQENFQDFFQYPEKDEFSIPADKWNTSSSDPINRIDIPQNKISKLKIDSKPNKENSQKNNNINKPKSTKNKRDKDKSRVTNEEDKSLDKKNIELREFIMKKKEENNKSNNQKENKEKKEKKKDGAIENSGDSKKGPTRNVLVVSNEKIKEKNIKKTIFDGMLSKFTEENGVKRAISRIEDMKDKKNLSINLTKFEPTDIKKEFFDTKKVDFPITILIPFGFYFANKFIKEAFDTNIPRSKFAVNILVDCSSFICNENKIFNMMLICALTTALDSLEIPYSAAVVADKNFKCIVKSFEEQHSPKCLQKILDCLLIKRYRTKLASSIKFAIDNMSFPVDKQSEVNKRPYRAIFTFSDGLDEQLILTNAWSKEILTEKNLSFGFIFIKSSKLADTNLELLENVWANFEKEVNKDKPIDIVKIASIKAEIDDDVSDKLNILFRTVMKRSVETDIIKAKQENIYSDATFSIDENLSDIKRFYNFINSDYHSLKEIYTKSPQVLKTASTKIDKLNPIKYRNKLKKIAICKLDKSIKKEDCSEFVKQFLINKQKINQASLEAIFKPNKASQTVLSTTGTDFEMTALVLNLLNPVPDPMIYLEEKGGLIRNYGISIVIDSSISCFDEISGPHSFQTLQNILSSLATLDISCFDLIIAGSPQPKVVCSEVSTIYSLSNKSLLFNSLLATLQNPTHNTDLSSAIHMAFDLRRMRSSESTSILFVLTNGLYDNKECERIVDSVNVCVQSGITTFGIGIGNYPKGIEKLFPHIIFSRNPANVMKGIATFYGDTVSLIDEMKPINFEPPLYSDFIEAAKILIENEKKPIFNSLKDSLKNIMLTLDAFDDMYNREISIGNAVDKYANPVGTNTEIYIRDLLKTQKILIVMLWDNSMNKENEEEYVHPDYITKPSKEGEECILSAVKYYGIELKIVRNYEAAIIELTKQTKKGYCDYYATWVFCGPPFEMLPEKNADPNLVGQFNEVLIKFWKNGGSIVFWAEGDPLYYQVNLFLETANFEDECASGKVSFRISGNHRGTNILYGEESDELATPKTFNRMKRYNKGLERSILSHNIRKIYEGITISYAPYNLEKIKPFKPFARDSEGGISSMFYEANIDKGTGDIVIDCGYTKCFTKMSTEGTFRYVQNIAAWTARPEVHRAIDGEEPCDWRPAAVTHNIIRGVVWPKFQILSVDPKKLQTLWAIDASESVKDNKFYHEQLKNIINEYYKEGDEFYLWSKRIKDQQGNTKYNGYERITYDQLQSFISNRRGKEGTQSSLIAEIASQSPINQHLLIVTDGAVGEDDVIASDNLMKQNNIRFNFVTTFIIHNEFDPTMRENLNDPNTRSQINQQFLNECRLKPDLSVGAPYSRRCQNITYCIKLDENNNITKVEMASLKSDDINALNNIDSINNYDDFVKQYDKLDHAIQASTLGQAKNTDLVNKLNSLKGRVKNSGLNSQQISDFDEKFEVLFRMASGELRNKFKLEDIAAAKKGIVK